MNVSSLSGSSGLYFQRMSSVRVQSQGSQSTQQMQGRPPQGAPPQGAPPQGPPPNGARPPDGEKQADGFMTDELKSTIDSITQSGGSAEEIKSALNARFDEYKQTDEYKALSSEQQTRMQQMRDGTATFQQAPFSQLQNSGYSTQSKILSSLFSQDASAIAA